MSQDILTDTTPVRALEHLKATFRRKLKEGTLQNGDEVDVSDLAPNLTSDSVEKIVATLRKYKGAILNLNETHTSLTQESRYTFTHGVGPTKLIIHVL